MVNPLTHAVLYTQLVSVVATHPPPFCTLINGPAHLQQCQKDGPFDVPSRGTYQLSHSETYWYWCVDHEAVVCYVTVGTFTRRGLSCSPRH